MFLILYYLFDIWKEISTLLAETEVRSGQSEDKRNESRAVDIDDTTIFGTLVTHAEKVFDVNDEIFRVINLLVQKQNQVIPPLLLSLIFSIFIYSTFSCYLSGRTTANGMTTGCSSRRIQRS